MHGDRYDYSRTEYTNSISKVTIICPKHGAFEQLASSHLRGQGCPKCFAEATRKRKTRTQEEFLRLAKEAHGDTYDYSKAVYVSGHSKICIICRKHGEFWQEAECHISGQGCPACLESAGEQLIRNTLLENGIKFESQKRFPDWLGKQSLDFFLPDFNIGIEHQGKQHYTTVKHWSNFHKIHPWDLRKKQLCAEHNIIILYLSADDIYRTPKENWEWMQPNLFTDIKDIIEYIKHLH